MIARRARRQSAFANDSRILDAAVSVACDVGLDRLTVSAVAKLAGFTSGAIYARFESREELLVGLWEQRAAASLEELIRQVGSFRRRGASDSYRHSIVQWLTDPPPELRIAIEACLIAHRVEELFDIVPTTVRSWFADLGLDHDHLTPDESVDLTLVAGTIGYVMLQGFPDPLAADLGDSLSWISAPAPSPGGQPIMTTTTAQELVMEPDDEVRNRLLLAAQSAIASSGVYRTTLTRIGRLARTAPTIIYSRYRNRDELIKDILLRAQVSNSQIRNRIDYLRFDQSMGAALRAYLQDEAVVRRRVHNETVVAAWHDPELAAVYSATEHGAMNAVADQMATEPDAHERVLTIQRVGLMAILGSGMVREILPEMACLDWRPAATLLLRSALRET